MKHELERLLTEETRHRPEDLVDVQIGDMDNLLRIIATQYETVFDAFKEFIANAKDAGANYIRIHLNTKETRGKKPYIAIEDNGRGMDSDVLSRMGRKVADSIKKNDWETIGKKGIGHFAYQKIGKKATYVSRGQRDESGATYQVDIETPSKRTKPFPASIEMDTPGTKVVIYELIDEIRRNGNALAVKSLVNDLKSRYRDWLLQDESVTIEVTDGKERVLVKPDPIPGIPLIDEIVYAEYKGERMPIYVQLKLRPSKGGKGAVGVSNHGERDIQDITKRLDDFEREPWIADELEGVISADRVQWVANRTTLDVSDPSYIAWRDTVRTFEGRISEALQEHRERQSKAETQRTYRRALVAYEKAFEDQELAERFSPLGGKVKYDPKGKAVQGRPSKGDGEEGRRKIYPYASGPGGRPDIDPTQKGTSKGSHIPKIRMVENNLGTPHIMSSFVTETGLLEVNTAHPSYVSAMQRSPADRVEYIALVLAREVAHWNKTTVRDVSQATVEMFCAMKPYLS